MVQPINMQIIANTVDEVAKISKAQEHNPVLQQINAQKDMGRAVERDLNTITESQETEKRGIDKDGQNRPKGERGKLLRKKVERKKEDEEEHHKGVEPDKGRILDVEG